MALLTDIAEFHWSFPDLDAGTLGRVLPGLLGMDRWPSLMLTVGLLLAALTIGTGGALAVQPLLKRLGRWRWLFRVLVFFPAVAWIWTFLGFWIGRAGGPVISLMPAPLPLDGLAGLAQVLWTWLPPVLLLALPVTAQMSASVAWGTLDSWRCLRAALWLGLLFVVAIEDAFDLPGVAAPLASGWRASDGDSVVRAVLSLVLLGVCGTLLLGVYRPTPGFRGLSAAEKIREGALAIGLSPGQVWLRHLLPVQLRFGIGVGLRTLTWIWLAWVMIGNLTGRTLGHEIHQAAQRALEEPSAPFLAAWPFLLCALFLDGLGRIIAPRSA